MYATILEAIIPPLALFQKNVTELFNSAVMLICPIAYQHDYREMCNIDIWYFGCIACSCGDACKSFEVI